MTLDNSTPGSSMQAIIHASNVAAECGAVTSELQLGENPSCLLIFWHASLSCWSTVASKPHLCEDPRHLTFFRHAWLIRRSQAKRVRPAALWPTGLACNLHVAGQQLANKEREHGM